MGRAASIIYKKKKTQQTLCFCPHQSQWRQRAWKVPIRRECMGDNNRLFSWKHNVTESLYNRESAGVTNDITDSRVLFKWPIEPWQRVSTQLSHNQYLFTQLFLYCWRAKIICEDRTSMKERGASTSGLKFDSQQQNTVVTSKAKRPQDLLQVIVL